MRTLIYLIIAGLCIFRVQAQETSGALLDSAMEDYRHLHQHPELSNHEVRTRVYLQQRLAPLSNLRLAPILATGLMAIWPAQGTPQLQGSGHTIVIRAEMDALPITENPAHTPCSQIPGVMHACGHDVHMAILLGLARVLNNCRPSCFLGLRLVLLFQPAEERRGGADEIIQEQALQELHPDFFLALHIDPSLPYGTLKFTRGRHLAGSLYINFSFTGPGGHVGCCRKLCNPIVAASRLVLELPVYLRQHLAAQDYIFRFTQFTSTRGTNHIPTKVVLKASLRALQPQIFEDFAKILAPYARRQGFSYQLHRGTPPLINDPYLASIFCRAASSLAVLQPAKPVFYADDFSFYRKLAPIFMFGLGARPPQHAPTFLHTPNLTVDTRCIAWGIRIWIKFLQQLAADLQAKK